MSTNPQRLGKYELRERLGRGGMAEVWKAFDTQLHRYVAIKILHADLQNDPTFIARFEREAQVIASLHHPNIVQIHDFHISRPPETERTIAYMVMDYIEGPTLAEYIRNTSRVGRFPSAVDIVHLFTPICIAIDYAHQKGMIHRDIKPANILLDRRNTMRNPMGEPVLTDFGIVKLLGASTGTMSGTWLGTPLYISPEQAQGHPGNERSDIYSLGCILYEICTGVQPFQGDSITAIMMQQISSMPTPPSLINPNIPPALTMVILRALAKDPAARFSSASIMAASLAEALNVPVPAELSLPTYPKEEIYGPTSFSSFQQNVSQGMISPLISSQMMSSAQQSQPISLSSPRFSAPATPGQGIPVTPAGTNQSILSNAMPGSPMSTPASSIAEPSAKMTPNQLGMTPPGSVPAQSTSSSTPPGAALVGLTPLLPPPSSSRRRPWWLVVGLIVLILLVIAAGLSSFFLFIHPSAPVATNQVVGSVRFLSSGRLYANNDQGINDEVQITLQNIPKPAPGTAYYAWLLGDKGAESTVIPLLLGNGPLSVNNGNVNYLYPGDSQHTNLLASYSRFLITEEDAQNPPSTPSPDFGAWKFAAAIPSIPNPQDTVDHFSMRDHLRHLLQYDPTIGKIGLQGGLDIWFLRNTQEILKWSIAADDSQPSKNIPLIRQQLINILYYLDGTSCIEPDLQHVPAGTTTHPENATIAGIARVALLEQCPQAPKNYVLHLETHMNGVIGSPGATAATRNDATQIHQELDRVKTWLSQIHSDAVQLADMSDAQLTQQGVLNILGDMATQARNAYAGQIDPATGVYEGGAIWIYGSIQHLAAFNVAPCTSTTTACV